MRHHGFLMGGLPEFNLGGAVANLQPTPSPHHTTQLKTPSKVRTVFPETWLWTNKSTG